MILQVSQQNRAGRQQTISDRNSSRASPTSESESKSSGPPTRRRIPVAVCDCQESFTNWLLCLAYCRTKCLFIQCGRCRRRKIKCSGDLGNGQGCTNCRSSGTPNCLFLRVRWKNISNTKRTGSQLT